MEAREGCGRVMSELELGAAIEAMWYARWDGTNISKRELQKLLDAALPHIERAVIQRLIEKLTDTEPGPNWLGYKAWACDWLRAELEGGGE